VWNASRLWAHQPDTLTRLFGLMFEAFTPGGLDLRQRGSWSPPPPRPSVTRTARWRGAGSWAKRRRRSGGGGSEWQRRRADGRGKAIAAWAPKVARDPNATTPADIQALRDAGLDDRQIFAITVFVALRLAFAAVNDSLGAQPDAQLAQSLPQEVREAVTYGRPVAT